jgi:hypothetical protein
MHGMAYSAMLRNASRYAIDRNFTCVSCREGNADSPRVFRADRVMLTILAICAGEILIPIETFPSMMLLTFLFRSNFVYFSQMRDLCILCSCLDIHIRV